MSAAEHIACAGLPEPPNATWSNVLRVGRDVHAGVRLDWTQGATDADEEVWGVSPYVTWYWSESLRFRVQYQHKGGDTREEDTLYFQATFTLGGHTPHP